MYEKDRRCGTQGVTIRGEEIKAHAKNKREANNNKEDKTTDDRQQDERREDTSGGKQCGPEGVTEKTTRVAKKEPRAGSRAATGAAATTSGGHATW